MIMWKDYPLIPLWNWVGQPPLKSKVVQKHYRRMFEQMDPWVEDQKHLKPYFLEAIEVLWDSCSEKERSNQVVE